jgi:putrescine transport system ATP-binding protein
MTLSSRIAVMNAGAFEQIGTPGEVYEYPANRFIANFIGNINLLEATVIDCRSGRVRVNCEHTQCVLDVLSDEQPANGSRQWIAVRPEKIHIDLEKPSAVDRAVLKGTVLDLGYFGNLSVYRVQLPSGAVVQVSAPNRHRSATHKVEWDDKVFISWDTASAIMLTK